MEPTVSGEMIVPRAPRVEGPLWHISNNPDLGELTGAEQEVVDHAIFQSADGAWHLWACIRGTATGRLLYHWEGAALEQPDWEPKGIALRVDRGYGESLDERDGQEWIQAPHVITRGEAYYMFYGGHNTELGESQICLALSADGRSFRRYRNRQGQSRLFVGPGEARDPMVIRMDALYDRETYHCYYAGHDTGQREPGKVYCRISNDLFHWSEPVTVNYGGSGGHGPWSAECPFVVWLDGYFYLFRTSRYRPPAETHVYRSRDPLDFGLDTDDYKVATLQVAAPEVIHVGEEWFISSVEDLRGGVQLSRLAWDLELPPPPDYTTPSGQP